MLSSEELGAITVIPGEGYHGPMASRTPVEPPTAVRPVAARSQLRRVRQLLSLAWLGGWIAFSCSLGMMADLEQYRVDQLTSRVQWSVLEWEARHLPPSAALGISQALRPVPTDVAERTVRAYVTGQSIEVPLDELTSALTVLVSRELADAGITPLGAGVFPPVLFVFTEPPRSLIVSPRTEIRLSSYALVDGELTLPEVESIEQTVERLNVSALVVEIGGIATYPTLIPPDTPPGFALQTIAHEWAHTALFLTPLGRAYARTAETRAINESTADVVGGEISRRVIERLGVSPQVATESPRTLDFRRTLREIRLEVDRRLAAADVSAAEAYMEEARQTLATQGIRLRRLNQAYFAFHGNYAEGPAGSTEIPDRLRDLRARSGSLGEFLARVGEVTTLAELRALTSGSR